MVNIVFYLGYAELVTHFVTKAMPMNYIDSNGHKLELMSKRNYSTKLVELLSLKNRQVCALFDKSMKLGAYFACIIKVIYK